MKKDIAQRLTSTITFLIYTLLLTYPPLPNTHTCTMTVMTSKAQAAFVLTFIPMNQCTVVTIATTVMENYKLNLHLITSLKADFVVVYVCNLHFDISLLMSYDVMWLSLDSFCYTVK